MGRVVAKKDADRGAKMELVFVVGVTQRIAGTTKNYEKSVVRDLIKRKLLRRLELKNRCGKPVKKVGSQDKGIPPVMKGHRGLS